MRSWLALALLGCGRVGFEAGSAVDAQASMGALTLVATTQGPPVVPSATTTIQIPPGTEPGDLMVLGMYCNLTGATVVAPAQWQIDFDQSDTFSQFRASYFRHQVAAGDPAAYSFTTTGTNEVAWALAAFRDAPPAELAQAMLISGTGQATSVDYMVGPYTLGSAGDHVVLIFIDDSGSAAYRADAWTPPPGMTVIAGVGRVAIMEGVVAGAGPATFVASVAVSGTSAPHGAVEAFAWAP